MDGYLDNMIVSVRDGCSRFAWGGNVVIPSIVDSKHLTSCDKLS